MTKAKIVGAMLAGILLAAPYAQPAEAAGQMPSIMSVSGSAQVEAVPDEATIELGVSTFARQAREAQTQNASKAQAVNAAVKALGVPAQDIRPRNYSFRPVYERTKDGKSKLRGYEASNTVQVRTGNLKLVGKLIDAALKSGADQVGSLSFSVRQPGQAKRRALAAAIEDARGKAQTMAQALGCRLSGIRKVTESTGSFSPRQYNGARLMEAKAVAAVETPIEAGELSLSATVHVDFIIAD